jgi:hypothetical protein
MSEQHICLFPLHTVLFPEGPLPLRIFEPRYLEMVSHCLRTDSRFGVCLIESGNEVGQVPTPYEVGTLARIADWHRRPDGLLGITAIGETRFRILKKDVRPNRLIEAEVELLVDEAKTALPNEYIPMADFLRQLVKHVPHLFEGLTLKYGDATWVGCRLAELLPLPLEQKQYLLQLHEPVQRLERLRELVASLKIEL